MAGRIKIHIIVFLFLFLLTTIASAQPIQINKGGLSQKAPDRIIVKFKAHVTPEDVPGRLGGINRLNNKFGATNVQQLIKKIGKDARLDLLKDEHGLTRTYTMKVPAGTDIDQMVAEFMQDPDVESAEPDYLMQLSAIPPALPNDPFFNNQWNLHNTGQTGGTTDADIDAPEAWDITGGSSSIVIAVIDTGVQLNHPDLGGKILTGYDFVNGDANPSDDNGHGTHVAGIAAANTNNSTGVAGVCSGCKILPVKIINSSGTGYVSDLVSGIIYAVDNGANVINLSIGGPDISVSEYNAVLYAYNAGRTIVAATANDGAESVQYPAGYKEVIAVGATDLNDDRTSYSNYGYHTDVVAPGGVISTYTGSSYATANGTSMAVPHVAGLAGLILSQNPLYTPDQVKWHIELSADDQVGNVSEDTAGWDKFMGWGRINAFNALQAISTGLTYSLESVYADSYYKGINPSNGTTNTIYAFKSIYFDDYNSPPSYVQVCIDSTCYNMTADTSATLTLNDGNFINGEQYVYNTTLTAGSHSYYFIASNGTLSERLPVNGSLDIPSVTSAPPNQPPVASNQSVSTSEDSAVSIMLSGTDPEGQTLYYNVINSPSNGVLSGTAPNLIYTPNNNHNGSDSFTFKVNDWLLDSNIATVSITVSPVNDPPVLNAIGPLSISEGNILSLAISGSDPDLDTLTFTASGVPTGATFNSTTNTYDWSPSFTQAGTYSVTFTVSDGSLTASEVVIITVTDVPTGLSITNTDSPDPVPTAGDNLTYTITVTNYGPVAGTGVVVTDTLDAGLTLVSVAPTQGACTGTTTISCDIGTLGNGGTAVITIVVTTSASGMISNTADVTGNEPDPDMANNSATQTTNVGDISRASGISTRGKVETGTNIMVGGFTIAGIASKKIMIRGRGPSMSGAPYNFTGTLPNPTLEIYSGATLFATVDDWQSGATLCNAPAISCGTPEELQTASVDPCQPNAGQTTAPAGCNLEAAMYITLPPGAYTAKLKGVNSEIGKGIVEVYDPDMTTLTNMGGISTRGKVLTGTDIMVGGFIISGGTSSKKVLIRGRGPSMSGAPYNFTGTLPDPTLEIYTGAVLFASVDNWQSGAAQCNAPAISCWTPTELQTLIADPCQPNAGQTTAPPGCNLESAIIMTLPPGAYTAKLKGVNNGTGTGIIEVYEMP